jgi:hypothetical protein
MGIGPETGEDVDLVAMITPGEVYQSRSQQPIATKKVLCIPEPRTIELSKLTAFFLFYSGIQSEVIRTNRMD